MLIVDQGLQSWMFFFQWERGGYTFQMLMTNAVPTAVYIYIYRKKKTFTVNIKNSLIFENGPHMVHGRSSEISLRHRRNFC